MKIKKVLRVTGKVLLILLLLIVLLLLTTTIVYHIKLNKVEKQLQEAGYYNPVSVGDHSLNVYACGNENGQHTIIALAGFGDGEMFLGWRQMTAEIEQDNRLVFIDRAGYGLSDDTRQEMTPETVVEEYRTALKNSGIEAPYLLMGHSLGGLYATYWECNYPDEIEGVVFVDGTFCFEIPEEEQLGAGAAAKLIPVVETLGFAPFIIRSDYGRFLKMMSKEQEEQAIYLMSKTLGASASINEMDKIDLECDDVWKKMKPTDIPKCYIEATLAYRTKEDFINDGISAESLINVYVDPSMKDAGEDAIYEEALRMSEQRCTEWAEPYYEKLGNCKVVELPGDHVIFLDKPEKCSKIIKEFIDGLDS
ncbi:alpha/beta hydrolase [Ruminococcus sp.]|uniref:alpha/beta fold hydrolase n=1 Tax=Ruminococcus sp. TaxID=41978 RepID=UPI0025F77B19|nr:alpha/beta hydrolase [Ruminococcus sp.]MCR4637928.1 alpha/beta hydrolase [Ruminococcus sp.]